jgi:hypothetical protein
MTVRRGDIYLVEFDPARAVMRSKRRARRLSFKTISGTATALSPLLRYHFKAFFRSIPRRSDRHAHEDQRPYIAVGNPAEPDSLR